jgi:hypothetical protein
VTEHTCVNAGGPFSSLSCEACERAWAVRESRSRRTLILLWCCARAWEGEARLVGNVRADAIAAACEHELGWWPEVRPGTFIAEVAVQDFDQQELLQVFEAMTRYWYAHPAAQLSTMRDWLGFTVGEYADMAERGAQLHDVIAKRKGGR